MNRIGLAFAAHARAACAMLVLREAIDGWFQCTVGVARRYKSIVLARGDRPRRAVSARGTRLRELASATWCARFAANNRGIGRRRRECKSRRPAAAYAGLARARNESRGEQQECCTRRADGRVFHSWHGGSADLRYLTAVATMTNRFLGTLVALGLRLDVTVAIQPCGSVARV